MSEAILINLESEEEIRFPVTPAESFLTMGSERLNFSTIAAGAIEVARGRLPETYAVSGMFFGEGTTLNENEETPVSIKHKLQKWNDTPSFKPKLRFIFPAADINSVVYFVSYNPHSAKAGGHVTYDLSLVEARQFEIKKYEPEKKVEKTPVRETKAKATTYTIKSGDNLWSIARQYTGDGAKYTELFNVNKKNLRSGKPNLIYPGEKLTIPQGWLK